MIEIARTWRVLGGGLVAGVIGVTAFAGATASADPLVPAPPVPAVPGVPAVAPAAPAAPVQNATTLPGGGGGGVNGNSVVAPPSASYPASSAAPATAPGAPGAAAAAPLPPTVTTPVSGTLRDYLQSKGVKLVAQKPEGFKALDITLPVPPRWTRVPDPNVPDAFAVIADRLGNSLYTSNAQVVVYKLVGNFDPREAMTHGFVDSQQLLAWQTTNASQADFGGFPSSIIEGTYRQNDMTLNTSRRNVIATSGSDKYLVSFAVTTDAAQAVADGPATDAIINGFRVTTPGAATPAPAPTPTPAPVGLPAQAPPAAPAGPPAATSLSGPAPMAAQQPTPNLLSLVPGLPPLPNLHLNLLGSPR
ncbi:LpqN/LpqT family lipoprotein [Mycobacterium sp.]|uniref:LpqN/LpqT family lipoprotein n=1 Tax=Mycobacterium sp. TaxID=1785 RepID=UPI003F9DB5B3